MIGAPAFLLASELVYRGTNDPATLASDGVRHRAAISVAVILLLVSAALTVPAAATVLRLAHERGRNLARVAVVLCTLGALGHAAYAGFSAVQLGTAGGDARQMTQLLQRANHSPLMAPLALCIESFAVGMLCLAFAAHRARIVGRATPIAMSAAFAIEAANLDSVVAGAAKEGLGLLAFGLVGLAVLRMDDQAWQSHQGQSDPRLTAEAVPNDDRTRTHQ